MKTKRPLPLKNFDKIMGMKNKIIRRLRHIYLTKFGPIARTCKSPPFPNNPDGKVLVHIGCGELNDARFINIDARAMPHVHYISRSLELTQFASNSIDLIYACHVLEHMSHRKLLPTLSNWFSRLKPEGILRLSVPNFDTIIEIYQDQGKSINTIKLPLLGGQEYDFNYHLSIFNYSFLYDLLQSCGFTTIREWDPKSAPYHNFDDWAGRKFIVGGKEYKLSLNLEASR